MAKFEVEITTNCCVEVVAGEGVFTPEFLDEFSRHFYDIETAEEHLKNIAVLVAVGKMSWDGFVEGYGYLKKEGRFLGGNEKSQIDITVRELSQSEDIEVEKLAEEEENGAK